MKKYMFTHRSFLLITIIITILLSMNTALAINIYLAPNGSDTFSGRTPQVKPDSKDGPVKTLTRARDIIRKLRQKGDTVGQFKVIVADGFYHLDRPLKLTPIDSGTTDLPVIYTAKKGSHPVFSGGQKITGMKATPKGIWKVYLPEVAKGKWYFEQLFVNNQRSVRAKTPNDGFYHIKDVKEDVITQGPGKIAEKTKISLTAYPKDFKSIANLTKKQTDDVMIKVYHKWDIDIKFISEIDTKSNTIVTIGRGMKSHNPWKVKTLYRIENFRAALDSPGEWFLSRAGWLYYYPLPGQKIDKTEIIAPVTEKLIIFQGKPEKGKFVENIQIQNLTFKHEQILLPSKGFEAAQAAYPIDAAVMADGARNITIKNCEFAHIGRYAVWFRQGCKNNTLEHCYLHDLGAGGVRIGQGGISTNKNLLTGNNVIDNNIICSGSRIFDCAVGVWIGQSGDNQVTHNDINDFYYTGISVGWLWGYKKSLAENNTIDYNHIYNIGQNILSDMGGVYCLGPSEGTTVNNNVIHNVYSHSYGGWGLYLDEGSTHVTMENNLVYDTKSGGFHQHFGKENVIRNNIFAFNKLYQVQATRVEKHKSFIFENNIVLFDKGVLLDGPWEKIDITMDSNCYWNTTGKVKILDKDLAEWQKLNRDKHSIIADPGFENPKKLDFNLKPNSPALKIGFKPFDYHKAGVYGSEKWIKLAREK